MDISKWKSVAIKKTDFDLLKGLCKDKFAICVNLYYVCVNEGKNE